MSSLSIEITDKRSSRRLPFPIPSPSCCQPGIWPVFPIPVMSREGLSNDENAQSCLQHASLSPGAGITTTTAAPPGSRIQLDGGFVMRPPTPSPFQVNRSQTSVEPSDTDSGKSNDPSITQPPLIIPVHNDPESMGSSSTSPSILSSQQPSVNVEQFEQLGGPGLESIPARYTAESDYTTHDHQPAANKRSKAKNLKMHSCEICHKSFPRYASPFSHFLLISLASSLTDRAD